MPCPLVVGFDGTFYLHPDIVSAYPHSETETWTQFIERIKSLNTQKRATYIYFQKDSLYGNYHPSIVDFIKSHNKVEINLNTVAIESLSSSSDI